MKNAAWVIGLVVGVTGCSGTIGGDLRDSSRGGGSSDGSPSDRGGASGGASGSEYSGGDSVSSVAGSAGNHTAIQPEVGGSFPTEGGSANRGGGLPTEAGSANQGGGFLTGGSFPTDGGSGNWGGGLPTGGAFPHGGSPNYGGGHPMGGSSAGGGQGGTVGWEPEPSCGVAVGALIAFDSNAPGTNRDVYIVAPDGTKLTRMTHDGSNNTQPSFSPLGNLLAFTSDRGGLKQIFLMDLATYDVRQLTQRPEGADFASFSPDGKLLTFHSGTSIFTIEADGSNETQIVGATDALLPPINGRGAQFLGSDQLVFSTGNGVQAINLDQSHLRNIIPPALVSIGQIAVRPAADYITYAGGCGSAYSIWAARAETNSLACTGIRLTSEQDPWNNTNPSWGPSDTFAYERYRVLPDNTESNHRITLINMGENFVPCSLTPDTQDSRNANWSPYGEHF